MSTCPERVYHVTALNRCARRVSGSATNQQHVASHGLGLVFSRKSGWLASKSPSLIMNTMQVDPNLRFLPF